MTINSDDLVKDALESKAACAAIANTADISFHEDFRKACEQNQCGKYNTNWMGPPAIGPISDLIDRVRRYEHGLLFQTVHQIRSSFDFKGMMEGGKVHGQIFRDLLEKVRTKYHFTEILALNAGCCGVCEKCAYLDNQPCRYPNQAVSSVEAYGINVIALEKSAGIPIYHGKNTVAYVGLILFED